ncbi:hypothetical protein TeGR_g13284, partial [Tetraparma gracilis]
MSRKWSQSAAPSLSIPALLNPLSDQSDLAVATLLSLRSSSKGAPGSSKSAPPPSPSPSRFSAVTYAHSSSLPPAPYAVYVSHVLLPPVASPAAQYELRVTLTTHLGVPVAPSLSPRLLLCPCPPDPSSPTKPITLPVSSTVSFPIAVSELSVDSSLTFLITPLSSPLPPVSLPFRIYSPNLLLERASTVHVEVEVEEPEVAVYCKTYSPGEVLYSEK